MSRLSLCLAVSALASAVTAGATHHTIDLFSKPAHPGTPARRAAMNKRASKAAATVPLLDYYGGTDLQWYGNISVGTPAQITSVVFDTGSDTLEFPSTACTSNCNTQHRFNTALSSTFVDGGRTNVLNFATGVNTLPVTSNTEYELHLRSGSDTVAIGGISVKKSPLYLITAQTAAFSVDPFDGIMGMPADGSGWLSSLSSAGLQSTRPELYPPHPTDRRCTDLFTMYLTPKSVGSAQLTFGSIDTTKYNGTLHYASVPEDAGDWELTSSAIYVNGKTTTALKASRQVVFDSGTSNVLFPTSTANVRPPLRASHARRLTRGHRRSTRSSPRTSSPSATTACTASRARRSHRCPRRSTSRSRTRARARSST